MLGCVDRFDRLIEWHGRHQPGRGIPVGCPEGRSLSGEGPIWVEWHPGRTPFVAQHLLLVQTRHLLQARPQLPVSVASLLPSIRLGTVFREP